MDDALTQEDGFDLIVEELGPMLGGHAKTKTERRRSGGPSSRHIGT